MGDISTERSMEDILSSIKRIIAEEGDVGPRPRRPRTPAPEPIETGENDDRSDAVLELGDFADRDDMSSAAEPEPLPAEPFATEPEPAVETVVERPIARSDEAILSERTAQATRGSLDALSKLIVRPQTTGSDTLEGLVRDMLRPMLSDWLDSHLPEIVERIVQREVERLTKR